MDALLPALDRWLPVAPGRTVAAARARWPWAFAVVADDFDRGDAGRWDDWIGTEEHELAEFVQPATGPVRDPAHPVSPAAAPRPSAVPRGLRRVFRLGRR